MKYKRTINRQLRTNVHPRNQTQDPEIDGKMASLNYNSLGVVATKQNMKLKELSLILFSP